MDMEQVELKLRVTKTPTPDGRIHVVAESVSNEGFVRSANVTRTAEAVVAGEERVQQAVANLAWDVIADGLNADFSALNEHFDSRLLIWLSARDVNRDAAVACNRVISCVAQACGEEMEGAPPLIRKLMTLLLDLRLGLIEWESDECKKLEAELIATLLSDSSVPEERERALGAAHEQMDACPHCCNSKALELVARVGAQPTERHNDGCPRNGIAALTLVQIPCTCFHDAARTPDAGPKEE